MINKNTILLIFTLLIYSSSTWATHVICIMPTEEDMTSVIRSALDEAKEDKVKLVFYEGTYHFLPDLATDRYLAITNHDNGFKKIIFHAKDFKSIEIVGNHSKFVFHGQTAPFVFENCEKVSVRNISIDWNIPFLFQGEVTGFNKEEGWHDIKPFTDGFSWTLENEELSFPNMDEFAFKELGATYPFNKETKDVVYAAKGMHLHPSRVKKLTNGNLRIFDKASYYPPVGTILCSTGKANRYAPAVYIKASKNIQLDSVIVHHALGMGFLIEKTENISLIKSGVYVSKGSDRVVSSIADATHFCNCRGEVLVDDCRFENMLDDGTNVHGTYVFVDEVLNDSSIRISLKHNQQKGFVFAESGDEIWFLHQPHPRRRDINVVSSVKKLNDAYSVLTFTEKLPEQLKNGDVLENKTWNPSFTMRGCRIGNHRARNIVLKTPLKTVIENNQFFSSDMASILFRGETLNWFESGAVTDVLIQNNYFSYCTHGASDQALLYISPKHGKTFQSPQLYDSNIRFINNTIETFDNRIVWAENVRSLLFKNNKITRTNTAKPLYPNAPMIELSNCKNARIYKNTYTGDKLEFIRADKLSKETLKVKSNIGF